MKYMNKLLTIILLQFSFLNNINAQKFVVKLYQEGKNRINCRNRIQKYGMVNVKSGQKY